MGSPPPTPPPRPFATRRHLAAYLRRHLGEHDVSVDQDYWGDDEDAMVDLVGAVLESCRDAQGHSSVRQPFTQEHRR